MIEFTDLPAYTGDKRPFDFIISEPSPPEQVKGFLTSNDKRDQYKDLILCMLLYQINRKEMYVNYMTGAKYLFTIFLGSCHQLKEPCHFHDAGMTRFVSEWRDIPGKDWGPNYEIQRLWLATKIHWSWLEYAWYTAEHILWSKGQPWQIARLERARPKCLEHSIPSA